jgi:hypothetical protein
MVDAGLDPEWDESGNQRTDESIGKHGNRRIRSILHDCVICTHRDGTNHPIRAPFNQLKE